MLFEIEFSGHENIRSNHQKTIEITRESNLTPSGDCIVGVNSSHACADLPDPIKKALRNSDCVVSFIFAVGPYEFVVCGRGHEELILSDGDDIVLRKSRFVCPRTAAIQCDKASDSFPREMISLLQDASTRGRLTIRTE